MNSRLYVGNLAFHTTEDGLPSNNVKQILEDDSGYLWIGTWEGLCRFDGEGFVTSLREEAGEEPRGKRVGLIGAGGGAKAVAYALARAEAAELAIFSRSQDRARSLVSHLRRLFGNLEVLALGLQDLKPDRLRRIDILINTTPVGMKPSDLSLFDYEMLPESLLVCDLIYRPSETPLLASARSRGCRVLNGAGMLLYQGAQALELWTGQKAPVPVMREALARGQGA
jgi:shikimate dehydrogenase